MGWSVVSQLVKPAVSGAHSTLQVRSKRSQPQSFYLEELRNNLRKWVLRQISLSMPTKHTASLSGVCDWWWIRRELMEIVGTLKPLTSLPFRRSLPEGSLATPEPSRFSSHMLS